MAMLFTPGRWYVARQPRLTGHRGSLLRQPIDGFETQDAALEYAVEVLEVSPAGLEVFLLAEREQSTLTEQHDELVGLRATLERERATWEQTRQAGAEQVRQLISDRDAWKVRAVIAERVFREGAPRFDARHFAGTSADGVVESPEEEEEFSPEWFDQQLAKRGVSIERNTFRLGDFVMPRLVLRFADGEALVIQSGLNVADEVRLAWNFGGSVELPETGAES
jgi:hypothetical protein